MVPESVVAEEGADLGIEEPRLLPLHSGRQIMHYLCALR